MNSNDEFFKDMLDELCRKGEATWLGINPCKEINIPKPELVTSRYFNDMLELHNAIHNYKEQAKRDRAENELLSQELGKEKLLNKSLEEEVDMLQTTESNELFIVKKQLREVEAVWQKRIQEMEKNASISKLERDKERRELKLMSELLEDKIGLINWHINARANHAKKYEKVVNENMIHKEQIEVLQEAIYGRDKKWGEI